MKHFPFLVLILLVVKSVRLEPTVQNEVGDSVSTLKLLHILFRHGDRTPIRTYPSDPYKDPKFWPVTWGQLTNAGKSRHYGLGQWVRARYSSFLPVPYSPDVVQVRSTDVDRTLMSAMSHLAGLYPPSEDQVWNPDIPWQPIPVHTRHVHASTANSYAQHPEVGLFVVSINQGGFKRLSTNTSAHKCDTDIAWSTCAENKQSVVTENGEGVLILVNKTMAVFRGSHEHPAGVPPL